MAGSSEYTLDTLSALTGFFENTPLYTSSLSYAAFYYELKTNTVNFGYGINLETVASSTMLQSDLSNIFLSIGVSINGTDYSNIKEVTSTTGPGLASELNAEIPVGVSMVQTAASKAETVYYNDVVTQGLASDLDRYHLTLNDLPSQQFIDGLYDLKYNANGSIYNSVTHTSEVPGLAFELRVRDWVGAAFDVGFNPSTSVPNRRVAESVDLLGGTPIVNGNQQLQLAIFTQLSLADAVEFLRLSASDTNVLVPSQTAEVTSVETAAVLNGVYVAQVNDSIQNIVSTQLNAFGVSTANLQQLISDINNFGSINQNLQSGQLVLVPILASSITTSATSLSSANYAFFYDTKENFLVATAPVGTAGPAGSLTVVDGTGKTRVSAQPGAVISISQSGPQAGVTLTLMGGQNLIIEPNGSFELNGQVVTSVDHIGIKLSADPTTLIDVDFDSGTSTLIAYSSNSNVETITGYSGPDGSGLPTDQIDNSADGTSIVTTYFDSGSETVTAYTGPNGTGTAETSDYQGLDAFYNWQGGQGDFGDASQWVDEDLSPPASDYAPGSSSFVEFENGGQVGGSGAAESITVDSPVTFTGTVQTTSFTNNDQIDVQGTLLTNSIEGGDATVEGTIDAVSGGFGSLDVKSGGDVETGSGAVTGNTTIEAGSTFNDDDSSIGGLDGTSITFTVDGADASWSSGETALIGVSNGSAAVTISDGAFADLSSGFQVGSAESTVTGSSSLTIASGAAVDVDETGATSDVEADASHSGSITIEGAGSELYSPQAGLTVYGQANFSLLDGATASVVSFDMNDLLGDGTGSSTVDGAQTDLSTVTLGIDDGTLTISNGAQLTLGGVIASSDDTIASSDTFAAIIGNSGTGVVEVQSGATITTDPDSTEGAFELSGMAGSDGTLAVNGAGSLVDLDEGGLTVGAFGNGTLQISDGGGLDAGSVGVGELQGGQGQVSVTGDGSYLSVDSFLIIGGQTNSGGQATLQISDGAIVDATDVDVDATGSVTLSGGELDTDPVTVDAGGNISGEGLVSGDITNSGTITATGGILELTDDITGSGTLVIDPNSTLLLDGAVDAGVTIEFASYGTGTLELADPADMQGTIIDQFPGDQVVDVACYLAGTNIATEDGERAVEQLAIGNRLVTRTGVVRPIKWIGTRSYDARFVANNEAILPIRFKAGALAEGVPHTDLLVSPLHAMFLHGVLVPAKQLINGVTITRAYDVNPICYFHIELDTHDIILANGAPAESFVDCDSRGMFQNEADYHARYPHDRGSRWAFCAPRIEDGHKLEEIRTALAIRAGIANDAPGTQPGPLKGFLDTASLTSISGWAWQPDHSGHPVRLEVLVDGGVVAQLIANRERADVRAAGMGDGRCGFDFALPVSLSPFSEHVIQVRRMADGVELGHSPRVLEAAPILDTVSRAALANAIKAQAAGAATADDLEDLLQVLVTGTERLLRARIEQPAAVSPTVPGKRKARSKRPVLKSDSTAPLALVIDDRLPTPDQDAGSNAVLDHMRSLKRLGYRVGFVPRDMAAKGRYAKVLEAESILCLGAPYYASVEEVIRRHGAAIHVVYLHRVGNAALYGEMVRQVCPRARIIYSVADLSFVRLARQAALEGRPALAALGRGQQAKELAAARQADAVITHSTFEAGVLHRALPGLNVHVVPWSFDATPSSTPFVDRTALAFIGGYGHEPNNDAARFLVRDVMPRVWQQNPLIKCLLVGSNMPESVSRLASNGVTAIGHVPDLGKILNQVRLTVAPMRFGAGLKGKVVQSLAAGVPCVCTPIAAEGIALPPALSSLIGGSADELATSIVRLHGDEAENARCAAAGLKFTRTDFAAERVDSLMQAVLSVVPEMAGQLVSMH